MEPLYVAYWPNLKFVALPVPEIIAIGSLGGTRTPMLGRGGRRGSGMVPFERALVSSYRPSIATFHQALRVPEILPRLCSSTPLFPTPPLVSPKFPHVPHWVDGCPLGYEERRCWTNCPCKFAISFQDFQPMWSWSTNVTDGRTDGRTDDMRSQYRALY